MSILEAVSRMPNVREPLPGLVTAGQPSAADFEAAKEAGIRVIIDTRDAMESRPFNEAETVAALGMIYCHIPVVSGALTEETLDRLRNVLREHEGTPLVVHCASANRVGGALIPYFILDKGMTEQEAVDLAMKIGLRSAELMDWGLAYARQHGS